MQHSPYFLDNRVENLFAFDSLTLNLGHVLCGLHDDRFNPRGVSRDALSDSMTDLAEQLAFWDMLIRNDPYGPPASAVVDSYGLVISALNVCAHQEAEKIVIPSFQAFCEKFVPAHDNALCVVDRANGPLLPPGAVGLFTMEKAKRLEPAVRKAAHSVRSGAVSVRGAIAALLP